MLYRDRIASKLTEGLSPLRLDVADVSHRHAGHAGARPEGETHFDVTVVSQRFEGLSRVARSRLVHTLLSSELEERVHALSLTLRTPTEEEQKF